MQSWSNHFLSATLLLALAVSAMILGGCASTESANLSERPWNSPKDWENGFPGGMGGFYQGR